MPRVDPDLNRDAAEDLVWPPPLEDIAACSVVPLEDGAADQRLLLIGGFPMAEADPRLRSKRLVDGEPMLPVTIGGFPVRELAPLFALPPPLPHPLPPPLPEFAVVAEPPPLSVAPRLDPVLEPAAVVAAPIAIPPVAPQPLPGEPATAGTVTAEPMPAEPILPEPLVPEPIVPAATAEAVFFAPAASADQLVVSDDQLIAAEAGATQPALDADPVDASVLASAPMRPDTATLERLFASTGLWGVRRAEPIHRPVEMAALLREPSSLGNRSRVAAALLVAASLALVSWTEFRAQRRMAPEVPVAASDLPAVPELAKAPTPALAPAPVAADERAPERVPVAPEPIAMPKAPEPPAPKVASNDRRELDRDETPRPTTHRPAATPVRWPSRPAVLPTMPTRPLPAPYAPARVTSVALATPASKPSTTPSTSTPAPASASAIATPAPVRVAAPAPVAAIDTPAPIPASFHPTTQEDNVRDILARWRTAYSQLDARAAKGVYPGLDQRALERAFQNLKSQDVRFDHCELKLRDETAQADCTGRAIYVPRIGNQTPITAPRAWRFDLKLDDRGWTIASARSS